MNNNALGKVNWAFDLSILGLCFRFVSKVFLIGRRRQMIPANVLNVQLCLSSCINDPYGSCCINLITQHTNNGGPNVQEREKTFRLISGTFP